MKVVTTITITETGIPKEKITRKSIQEYLDKTMNHIRDEFGEDTHDIAIELDLEEE
jgi:hypothetical protein